MKTWNRVEDEMCVKCGAPLLSPKDSVMGTCVECLEEIRLSSMTQIRNKAGRKGTVKRMRLRVPAFMVKKR